MIVFLFISHFLPSAHCQTKKHECKCSCFPDNYSFSFYKFCSLRRFGLKRFPKKLIMNQSAHLVHGLRPDKKRYPAVSPDDKKQPHASPPQQFPVLSHCPAPPHFHNFQRRCAAPLYPFAASPDGAPLPRSASRRRAPEPLPAPAFHPSGDESGLNAAALRRNRSGGFISSSFTAHYNHIKTHAICPIKAPSLRRNRTPFTRKSSRLYGKIVTPLHRNRFVFTA